MRNDASDRFLDNWMVVIEMTLQVDSGNVTLKILNTKSSIIFVTPVLITH